MLLGDPPRGKISGEAEGLCIIAVYGEVRSCNSMLLVVLFLTPLRFLWLIAGKALVMREESDPRRVDRSYR